MTSSAHDTSDTPANTPSDIAEIVIAGGCFWCVEGVYAQLDGIIDAESGYAGGKAEHANYAAVCSGLTDHAEVVKLRYDPATISLEKIFEVFFTVAHNPTHLNRQGNDKGRQYRSAVFYKNPAEKEAAEAMIAKLTASKHYSDPIVTTLEPLDGYYTAEADHQNFAADNPYHGYIRAVAKPKIDKVRKNYPDALKD